MNRYSFQRRDFCCLLKILSKPLEKTLAKIYQVGNKIANKLREALKNLPQNTSETVQSETKTRRGTYISPEKRQQIIDELRLLQQYNNGKSKNNKSVRKYTKSTI